MKGRAVVITGLGTVNAYGCGAEGLARALAESRPRLSEVDRSAGYHRRGGARRALLAGEVPLAPWLSAAESRRMSPPSKLAVAAARVALADAGLAGTPAEPSTAVALATSFGPSSYTEALLKQVFLESPEAASPFLFTECVANAPAAQVAIAAGARGASMTMVQREAGPLLAVARGAAEVAAGRSRRALVGAVEEMTPLVHALLDRFAALSRGGVNGSVAPGCEAARPFDRRRDGFLAAEGATVLVLESEEAARERGARPLGRIAAWGSAFDPTAPPSGWGQGDAELGRALARFVARAGRAPADFDRIVSGASGSRAGDRLEARALGAAWGESALPPVLAPKGVTGEYGGAFLAAAVLAARGAPFGPTAGFAEPDPELGLVPHDGRPLPPPGRRRGSSLAAGGAAAWLMIDSIETPKRASKGSLLASMGATS